MVRVIIVGAGQIGSRHLQSLVNFSGPISVDVVDPKVESLETAKSRLNEVCSADMKDRLICRFLSNDSALSDYYDVGIISTSANVRRRVVEALIQKTAISNLILEKVLFQKLEDYDAVDKILEENHIRTWVNCNLLNVPEYQKLVSDLSDEACLEMTVSGAQWGIGCNSLHFIHLFAQLSGSSDLEFDSSHLSSLEIAAKREGFREFEGELLVKSSKGRLILKSYSSGDMPLTVSLSTPSFLGSFIDLGGRGEALIRRQASRWDLERHFYNMPFQSQVTSGLVDDILNDRKVLLPTYREASVLHKGFIQSLIRHLERTSKERIDLCPIT